jgi:hypothetical protein
MSDDLLEREQLPASDYAPLPVAFTHTRDWFEQKRIFDHIQAELNILKLVLSRRACCWPDRARLTR